MCTSWSMANSSARVDQSSPTGWRQKATRNGSKSRPRSRRAWRQSDGNRHPAHRRRRQLQGKVRLLRSREVRLQGEARPEPGRGEGDLLDEERAGMDDKVPAALPQRLREEGNAQLGR